MPSPDPNDDVLIARAQAGDADALAALVERYEPRVYRFAVRLCGNADDAADVAQETLLALTRSVSEFRGDATLSTWLYTVALRFCGRTRRRTAARSRHEAPMDSVLPPDIDRLVAPGPNPEQLAAQRQQDETLIRALDALPAAQREVLILRDMEGLTAPETAEVLGLGVRAVKSRLHRARLALRTRLLALPAAEPVKPGCRDVLERFSGALNGELSPALCADLDAHLARCPGCRGACDSLREILGRCRETPAAAVPAPLQQSLREAVRQFRTAPRR